MAEKALNIQGIPNTPTIQFVRKLSFLMDEQFRIPGTKYRFGLDPIFNLIPFVGDLTGFLISSGLVLAMASKGLTSKIVVLMCINILLDSVFGAIPGIGQVWDFFFKSNTRNMKLMEQYYLEGKHQGSGKSTILIAIIAISVIFIILLVAVWFLISLILSWF
ncbi:DUF4112 domain-containing protein [Pedobacter sp. PLR]|uniref:DUF4112 domain-containing protein n=1 Tax=Pedobacter sp. PLR TaxID=2994465 RepID=UPI002246C987|nr:DUF4112 domain-containing protein [Pedobacter sp. PLR]MCX2453454.1 DUF4112 domain-containing protein [Pedobacter sp. PLR]